MIGTVERALFSKKAWPQKRVEPAAIVRFGLESRSDTLSELLRMREVHFDAGIPIIMGMPPHITIIGAPMAIIEHMASQRSRTRPIIDASVGIIFIIMPSFVISQDILHITGVMPPAMGIIMGIIMPFIMGIPPIMGIIMPFIIMGIPPIMGIMPPLIIGMLFMGMLFIGMLLIGMPIIDPLIIGMAFMEPSIESFD